MIIRINTHLAALFLLLILILGCSEKDVLEAMKWSKITLDFEGPHHHEMDNDPNPFLDYRLMVEFSNGKKSFLVPGYFAADGNASETSADEGNIWRVHFSADEVGLWDYKVSFRKGNNIAVSDDPGEGTPVDGVDGKSGKINVVPLAGNEKGNFLKGRLEVTGERYLRFAESGEYFLKAGVDAPENLLAYADFDGGFKTDGHKDNYVKTWEPHVKDWNTGDPQWQNEKGKGLIGALNYLADQELNAFSFLTHNIVGDDQNVFPYVNYDDYEHMDISRLDQWEVIFSHADRLGLFLHIKTQETENQGLLDGGDTGIFRKLYYRELIARYSHHLALNWNLGEENGPWMENHPTPPQTTEQRRAMAEYFASHDPYGHHIVIHNGKDFNDMLGPDVSITGVSIQTDQVDFSKVHNAALTWLRKSKEAGKQWVVAVDEPGDAQHSLLPDAEDSLHDDARKNALWGALMAGAMGLEWYFGYDYAHSDLSCEDWRSREKMWEQCRHALRFFKNNSIPFWEMEPNDNFTQDSDDFCLVKEGEVLVVYRKTGGDLLLDLTSWPGNFNATWYNPRNGTYEKPLLINGGGQIEMKTPMDKEQNDWVLLMSKTKQ